MNLYSLEFLCSSQGAGGLLTWISLTTQTKVASCNKLISNTQLSMNIQQIYTTNDDLAWEHCTIQGRINAHLANFDGDVWHIFNEPAQRFLSPSHIWKLCCFFVHHLQKVIFSFINHLCLCIFFSSTANPWEDQIFILYYYITLIIWVCVYIIFFSSTRKPWKDQIFILSYINNLCLPLIFCFHNKTMKRLPWLQLLTCTNPGRRIQEWRNYIKDQLSFLL